MSKEEIPSKKKKVKEQYNSFLKYSGLGIQMAVIIFASHYLGVFLDEKYGNESETFNKIFTILGVFLSVFMVILQVTRESKNND